MARLWRRIRFLWHEFRKRRKYGAAIRPEGIRAQAEELGHLAELAQPMAHLADMTRTADFCRLAADRRLALYDNLRDAREKLLASIQKARLASEKPQ